MRWYVSRNGESTGPHEEAIVAEWGLTGKLIGAMLRDEAASAWVPVSQTPFLSIVPGPRPSPMAKPPNRRWLLVLFALCLVAAFSVFVAQCGKPSIQERAEAMDARERAEAHQFNVDRAAKAAAEAAALAARDRDRVGPSAVDAWVMAKHFVTNSLKSPSTADFGSLLDGTYQSGDDCCRVLSGGAWRCSGWVDAQNSFGAKTRANFTIDMKPSGTGWVVTNGPDLTER